MRLEKYLVLNKYLLSLFGASSISDLREELKNKKEGFDNDGKSYFVDVLIGFQNLKINLNDLLQYDSAIKEYSQRLSNHRRENITLKYFQYLAVLFVEIYLDRYFNKKICFYQNLIPLDKNTISRKELMSHLLKKKTLKNLLTGWRLAVARP